MPEGVTNIMIYVHALWAVAEPKKFREREIQTACTLSPLGFLPQ
jgi:hypothetical protein